MEIYKSEGEREKENTVTIMAQLAIRHITTFTNRVIVVPATVGV